MKACTNCGNMKQMFEFPIFRTNKMGTKNYYNKHCRTCLNEEALIQNQLKKENPPPPPGTPCACCGRIDKLWLDHCHVTKQFRGYICRNCNVSLGYMGDCEEGVQMAVDYLRRSNH